VPYKYVQLDPDYNESDFRTTVILADTLESILKEGRKRWVGKGESEEVERFESHGK